MVPAINDAARLRFGLSKPTNETYANTLVVLPAGHQFDDCFIHSTPHELKVGDAMIIRRFETARERLARTGSAFSRFIHKFTGYMRKQSAEKYPATDFTLIV